MLLLESKLREGATYIREIKKLQNRVSSLSKYETKAVAGARLAMATIRSLSGGTTATTAATLQRLQLDGACCGVSTVAWRPSKVQCKVVAWDAPRRRRIARYMYSRASWRLALATTWWGGGWVERYVHHH